MNAWTLGDLKKAIADCPELGDDTPVYISVFTRVAPGEDDGVVYALEEFGTTGPGGVITLGCFEGGMDDEDHANLL